MTHHSSEMTTGFIFWVLLPAIFAVAAVGISLALTAKIRTGLHGFLSFWIAGLCGMSLYALHEIFYEHAYATFFPHIMIVAACGLVVVQIVADEKRTSRLSRERSEEDTNAR